VVSVSKRLKVTIIKLFSFSIEKRQKQRKKNSFPINIALKWLSVLLLLLLSVLLLLFKGATLYNQSIYFYILADDGFTYLLLLSVLSRFDNSLFIVLKWNRVLSLASWFMRLYIKLKWQPFRFIMRAQDCCSTRKRMSCQVIVEPRKAVTPHFLSFFFLFFIFFSSFSFLIVNGKFCDEQDAWTFY
jgi:hypothetical protein